MTFYSNTCKIYTYYFWKRKMVEVIFLPSLKFNLKTIFYSFELQSGAKCLILVTEINRINVKTAAVQNRTVSNY